MKPNDTRLASNDGTVEQDPLAEGHEEVEDVVQIEDPPPKYLVYGLTDSPPIHITIICGIQVLLCNPIQCCLCNVCLSKVL